MKFSDKAVKVFGWAAVILAIVLFIMYRRGKAIQQSNAADPLGAFAGPSGFPFTAPLQYGAAGSPFQMNVTDPTMSIPQFHYSGNQTIYMPLFGFVGYGAQGL